MILAAFTLFHVLISLIGIGSGLIVVYGLLKSKLFSGWTTTYLTTTVATSLTGFLFPVHKFMPSHAVGILSLIALALAIAARYRYGLAGGWRKTWVISCVVALYFNVFVLIAQLFQKVPALRALAPTQSERPFQITQLMVLLLFILIGISAATRFRAGRLQGA